MLRAASHQSAGPGDSIKAGDLVIVYERHDSMKATYVDPKKTYSSKFGHFQVKNWVGRPFGSRVVAKDGSGWVFLLAPTPELWTQVLKHRTQILYVADISLICTFLELRPGCIVLESGTGSGSLTHSLARAVGPGGHVHTFDFHQQRAEEAAREFQEHNLLELITVQQRDIEALGFPEERHGLAHAVFLDLPGPWKVVRSAARCLKPDGVFCSFSPCIEQVQRTCGALSQAGFHNVRTMECLLRQYDVHSQTLIHNVTSHPGSDPAPSGQRNNKKRRRQGEQDVSVKPSASHAQAAAEDTVQQVVTARPHPEARGHTGYLTFARRIVEEGLADGEVDEDFVPETAE